ncbi:MAG: hypothetical protein B7Y41_11845 [Hydrogenophilales bacterium 28-61-23]|nr:MAG: hypothetical protein B7Y41_11845 [Hydrogenophilales bacterium 28-61-23]
MEQPEQPEQRKSERVQFFQMPRNEELVPVWVFQRASEDSVLGLLLDFSSDGVQILTDKSRRLDGDAYELIAYVDETDSSNFVSARVHRQWSKPVGTLYIRNGFSFADRDVSMPCCEAMFAARDAGLQWLRCEIVTPRAV